MPGSCTIKHFTVVVIAVVLNANALVIASHFPLISCKSEAYFYSKDPCDMNDKQSYAPRSVVCYCKDTHQFVVYLYNHNS